ncbi:MAG: hypothetical protein P8Y45_19960, partial [Exilibacterium sp.]
MFSRCAEIHSLPAVVGDKSQRLDGSPTFDVNQVGLRWPQLLQRVVEDFQLGESGRDCDLLV